MRTIPPTARELESALEAHFTKAVRAKLGGRTSKLAPTEKGIPDRMVMLPGGRIILVELKTNIGRLSEAQKLWHYRAAELGTNVVVLAGRAEIDAWINAQLPSHVPVPRYKKRVQG
jgi:hypothetical protein